MKILHIHRFGLNGGAGGAISMRRLHSGLRKAGIDSKILCVRETEPSSQIVISKASCLADKWNSLTEKITKKFGLEDVLNINAFRISKNQVYRDADVINFHRVPNVFSYLSLPFLTSQKPAVLTLCEMWSVTGHCRYSLECDRWKTSCGKCPNTHLPPAIVKDGTHLQWSLKNWVYRHSDLTLVAKSKWMLGLVKQSMLRKFPIHHIPNGIDTEVYRPRNRKKCRALLNIPANKRVILFGAKRLDLFIKGSDLMIKAINGLPGALKDRCVLLLFGNNASTVINAVDIPAINLGFIEDDFLKSAAYSVADIFLCPSRAENFPNVVLESMACGTPTVAFNVSSLPELVRPGVTGYLAEIENADSFRERIVELIENNYLRERLGQNCRETVIKEYTLELLFNRYFKLYRQITDRKNMLN